MREIPLLSKKYPGLVALIDDDDADLVAGYSWRVDKRPRTVYAKAYVPGTWARSKDVYMHRLIRPDLPLIDHADRDGLNNTRANLRPATQQQQNANQGLSRSNTSGFKGVWWRSNRSKWQATIQANGKRKRLGTFANPEDAARAYDAAAREVHGEFAVCNFSELETTMSGTMTDKKTEQDHGE